MALPTGIDPTTPAGSDSPGQGDDQFRALKTFNVDILGLTAGTNNYSEAVSLLLPTATLNQWPTVVRLLNSTGTTITRGDVVGTTAAADKAVAGSNTKGSLMPLLVMADTSVAHGSSALFWKTGVCLVNTTGTVNRGEYLWKSASAQVAESSGVTAGTATAPPPGAFALALTAASGNVCTALLFGHTHQGTGLGARVRHSANQTIAHTTLTALQFNSERYDLLALHSIAATTERLTVPVEGVYHIWGGFRMNQVGAMAYYLDVVASIRLNGTTEIARSQSHSANTKTNVTFDTQVSTIYRLAATDYVELMAYHENSAATSEDVLAAGNYSPEFAIHYLGA